jgi:glycosyltransferase involved in cell wall biosynthesis
MDGVIDESSITLVSQTDYRLAVLVPCFNEEATVEMVVTAFKSSLPMAEIYVYDNNSTDQTIERATAVGATVRHEILAGKGNVVRRMFSDVEADIYILVDGDATYDAASAPDLVAHLINRQLDMVVGARISDAKDASYRFGHRFGNTAFTWLVGWIFGNRFSDLFSGYRVFSRRFVKTFPALSTGFETETELTVHALELNMPIDEIPTVYSERPDGSASKLNTVRDGFRILRTIGKMLRDERPIAFFGGTALGLATLSVSLALPLITGFIETGLVPRIPTAVLCMGMMLLAFFSLACGFILDSVRLGRREAKRLRYLAVSGIAGGPSRSIDTPE